MLHYLSEFALNSLLKTFSFNLRQSIRRYYAEVQCVAKRVNLEDGREKVYCCFGDAFLIIHGAYSFPSHDVLAGSG